MKADPLSKSLGVSRGSFYWHFKSVGQFQEELLNRYHQQSTKDVIFELEQGEAENQRFERLMHRAVLVDKKLERAVRAWATQNVTAAKVVRKMDDVRLDYLATLLKSAGVADADVRSRAKFIYLAYLGSIMMGEGPAPFAEVDIGAITRLMLSYA